MSAPVCRRCGEPFRESAKWQFPTSTCTSPEEALRSCLAAMRLLVRGDCQIVGPDAGTVSHAVRMALAEARIALREE